MADITSGIRDRAGKLAEQARGAVGRSQVPAATDAEGRTAIVREALRAFGAGDFDSFFGSMDDGVEWVAPGGPKFPAAGTHTGRDSVAGRFLEEIKRTYSSFGFRPEKYLESEAEETVAVIGHFVAEPIEGHDIEAAAVQLWDFDAGKVARVRIYTDTHGFPEPRKEEEEKEEREEKEGEEAAGKEDAEGREDQGAKDQSAEDQGAEQEGDRGTPEGSGEEERQEKS